MTIAATNSGLSGNLSKMLTAYLSDLETKNISWYVDRMADKSWKNITPDNITPDFIALILRGIKLYVKDPIKVENCKKELDKLIISNKHHLNSSVGVSRKRMVIELNGEDDIVVARNKARQLAEEIGFSKTAQIKIATAVSELARNVIRYVGFGWIRLKRVSDPKDGLEITCIDKGRGIDNLDEIFAGDYKSKTGLGLGIVGCKKLMDEFSVMSNSSGTVIHALKYKI